MHYEHCNFAMLQSDTEQAFMLNPGRAVFTNACCIKVMLLKLLTEEVPLRAVQEIMMDWACDAYQTGYTFIYPST